MEPNVIKWIKIIAEIALLIAGGMSKANAVATASKKFGISESKIWGHGGF